MIKFLKETSGLAIFSFLFGVFSLLLGILIYFGYWGIIVFSGPLFGFTAIIFGILACIYLKKTKLKGDNFAYLGIGLGILSWLCYLLFWYLASHSL